MAELPIDIEKLVREVLAELEGRPAPQAAPPAIPKPAAAPPAPQTLAPPQPQPDTLVLDARVLSLAEIDGRLGGKRRLVVAPGTVVTPAVRDELQRRSVSLVIGEAKTAPTAAGVRLAVVAMGTKHDPASLLKALEANGIHTTFDRRDCLIATVDALVVELARPNTLALVLTRHLAAALCLANRVRGLRAVTGSNAAEVVRNAEAVGANLLVVDPVAAGAFRLKQMVEQFCRLGPLPCPEVLQQRLG